MSDGQSEVATVSAILMVVTMGVLVLGWMRRTIDVFSFHTMFTYGMVHFFLLSLALMPVVGYPANMYVPQGWGWVVMAALLPPFMLLYFYFNRVGGRMKWVDKYVPKMDYPVTTNGIMAMLIFMCVITGLTYLVTGFQAGVGDVIILNLRPGFSAVIAGLAAALFMCNPRNPFYIAILIAITVIGVVLSTVTGADRRFPLSVMLAVAFVIYWLWGRFQSLAKLFTVLTAMGLLAFVFTLMYTNVRHEYALQEATIEKRAEQLGDLVESYNPVFIQRNLEMLFLQDAPLNSCFLIENYPSNYDLVWFNGPWAFIVMPIPRSIWPGKPEGLGETIQRQMGVDANLAPGIIGQGWAELVFVGVAYYAIFFGLLTGAVDRLIRNRAQNPYFLIIAGCSLGNIFGLPRGGTFHFLHQWVSLAFFTWLLMWLAHVFMKSFMASGRRIYWGPKGPTFEPPEAQGDAAVGGELDGAYDHAHDEHGLTQPGLAETYGRSARGPAPSAG